MSKKNRIRLYIDADLNDGVFVVCQECQAHYLQNVLRLKTNDEVFVFNGRDGEFEAVVAESSKKKCVLSIQKQFMPFEKGLDVWLMFAPLKKDQTDFVVSKAVELGAAKIVPVMTEYTTAAKVRPDRLQNLIIEAAEQCRRQDIPELESAVELKKILKDWQEKRILFYFDETGRGTAAADVMPKFAGEPAGLLIGPEGGFSQKELEILRKLPYACGISLGRRILRAETAAVAGLSCWQALCGDWAATTDKKEKPVEDTYCR